MFDPPPWATGICVRTYSIFIFVRPSMVQERPVPQLMVARRESPAMVLDTGPPFLYAGHAHLNPSTPEQLMESSIEEGPFMEEFILPGQENEGML